MDDAQKRYDDAKAYSIRTRKNIVDAGRKAIAELLDVAKEKIIKPKIDEEDKDLAADRLKNAAAAKKMAIFDAFEILSRIEKEEDHIQDLLNEEEETDNSKPPRKLAEGRSRSKK